MSIEPLFRAARREDLPAIIAMLADDALGSGREDTSLPPRPGYVAAFEAISADPNQILAVMEWEGAVVGTLQLTFLPGLSYQGMWHGLIEAVRIVSHLRGKGLGHRLIGWAVDQCRARGCGVVQLMSSNSRTDAQRFYRTLGFKPSHVGMKLMLG